MCIKLEDTSKVATLFKDWQDTLIWSCMQKVMGEIYVDQLESPKSAMAQVCDFSFLTGEVNKALISYKPEGYKSDFIIMVPQDEAWAKAIEEVYSKHAKRVVRYAIKKEKDIFDENKLKAIVELLPEGYEIKPIDEMLYYQALEAEWSRSFVENYADYEEYAKLGFGFVILKDQEMVSGASAYSRYTEGVEIEIDTRKGYRRQGLASICAAQMILECLSRNLYPSWDAQNKWSVMLAEKLGYHYDHDYIAYEIYPYEAVDKIDDKSKNI